MILCWSCLLTLISGLCSPLLPAFHMHRASILLGLCVGFWAYFPQQISLAPCTAVNKQKTYHKTYNEQLTIYEKCHKVKIKEIIAQQKLPFANELVFVFDSSPMPVACSSDCDLFSILLRSANKCTIYRVARFRDVLWIDIAERDAENISAEC